MSQGYPHVPVYQPYRFMSMQAPSAAPVIPTPGLMLQPMATGQMLQQPAMSFPRPPVLSSAPPIPPNVQPHGSSLPTHPGFPTIPVPGVPGQAGARLLPRPEPSTVPVTWTSSHNVAAAQMSNTSAQASCVRVPNYSPAVQPERSQSVSASQRSESSGQPAVKSQFSQREQHSISSRSSFQAAVERQQHELPRSVTGSQERNDPPVQHHSVTKLLTEHEPAQRRDQVKFSRGVHLITVAK